MCNDKKRENFRSIIFVSNFKVKFTKLQGRVSILFSLNLSTQNLFCLSSFYLFLSLYSQHSQIFLFLIYVFFTLLDLSALNNLISLSVFEKEEGGKGRDEKGLGAVDQPERKVEIELLPLPV